MTAIDTSKLKKGMKVEYKLNGNQRWGFIEKHRDWWRELNTGRNILTPDGSFCNGITDVVFPDLQEQDRVEAWKPGDNALGFEDMQLTIIAIHGNEAWCKYSNCGIDKVHSLSMLKPIPQPDPDGELRAILVAYKFIHDQIDHTISQIKSLLAAKIPNVTREQFESKFVELIGANGNSMGSYTAWLTFLHFTKKETK